MYKYADIEHYQHRWIRHVLRSVGSLCKGRVEGK